MTENDSTEESRREREEKERERERGGGTRERQRQLPDYLFKPVQIKIYFFLSN